MFVTSRLLTRKSQKIFPNERICFGSKPIKTDFVPSLLLLVEVAGLTKIAQQLSITHATLQKDASQMLIPAMLKIRHLLSCYIGKIECAAGQQERAALLLAQP